MTKLEMWLRLRKSWILGDINQNPKDEYYLGQLDLICEIMAQLKEYAETTASETHKESKP